MLRTLLVLGGKIELKIPAEVEDEETGSMEPKRSEVNEAEDCLPSMSLCLTVCMCERVEEGFYIIYIYNKLIKIQAPTVKEILKREGHVKDYERMNE